MNLATKMILEFVILTTLLKGICGDIHHADSEERRLFPHMMQNRVQAVPLPPREDDQPVKVELSVHIIHFRANTVNQEYEVTMYFREGWKDPRLAFESSDPGNYRTIEDRNLIWTPDLFFVNEAANSQHSDVSPQGFIRVYPDGNVLTSQRLSVRGSCPMNLRKYPFDSQVCHLDIESYGYTADQMLVNWNESVPDPVTGEPAPVEFYLTLDWETEFINFKDIAYGRSIIKFKLRRNPTIIVFRIFLPITTILVFSYASFFFNKKEVCIRLTLCLAPIVTYLLQLNFGKNLFIHPGYPTGLDIWASVCFIAMLAALFEFIYVSSIHSAIRRYDEEDFPENDDDDDKIETTDLIDIRFRNIFACAFITFNTFCGFYIVLG